MGAFAPPTQGLPGMPQQGAMGPMPGGGFNPSQPSVTGAMGGGVSGFGRPGGGAWGRGPFGGMGGGGRR